MSKPVYQTFLALFFSLIFINSSFGDLSTPPPTVCPPNDCGNGVTIRYPFWKMNGTSTAIHFCGYPEFGLWCSNNGEPVLKLTNDTYYVKDINYTDSTITLADIDATGQTCPRARHNLTLDNLPLNYSTGLDVNLNFYFNCTSNPFSFNTSTATPLVVGCLEFELIQSYVVMVEDEMDYEVDWVGKCLDHVVVTVMRAKISGVNGLISEFAGAMNHGFVLDWGMTKECVACEVSGGFCGYNKIAEEFLCFCSDGSTGHNNQCHADVPNVRVKVFVGIGGALGVIGILTIIYCFKRMFLREFKTKNQDFEVFLKSYGPLSIRRYNFSQVKKITHNFKVALGQGGYGSVYKGKLFDGRLVAVKILKASKGSKGEEFINEVASISRTSHVNIVTLLGFCLEGEKRVLIYEFMPNGSLNNFICYESTLKPHHDQHLEWEVMHQITVGIARGLEYLHRGCNTRIVHFDIKPHNILLDEKFCPKISDFGLAKLCTKMESIVSMLEARGTIGYIAPEVFSRSFGKVSYKSDVYSYGMMVLEMIGGRKKDHVVTTDHASETYFPNWIYKRLELDDMSELYGEISMEETEIVRKMTMVGLWCIQTNPIDRPSMSKVLEMLQGSIESLKIPPKLFIYSPPRSPTLCSSTASISIE